ncbi:MAG: phosphatase PAP2 family protein [bacterium]|nr:phosphatase PAP2 family protein [bacterium]
MDEIIFKFINNFAGQNQTLDYVGIFFAEYLFFVLVGLVIVLWLYKSLSNRNVSLAFVSVLVIKLLAEGLKHLIDRPRPFTVMDVNQLIERESGLSFPSGHTMVLFALAFSFYGTRWFWPFIVLASLGSLARVFVGVHYITDILGGIVIAALVVWGLKILFKKRFLV